MNKRGAIQLIPILIIIVLLFIIPTVALSAIFSKLSKSPFLLIVIIFIVFWMLIKRKKN